MYLPCSSEKAALQQRKFEDCMLDAMLRQTYDSISVSQLCRDAGLSRKTFYRLFTTKGDVVYALIDHTIMDAAFYQPDESVGSGEMHRFFSYWRNQKKLLDALQQNKISNLLPQRCIEHILRESPDILQAFGTASSEYAREAMLFYINGLFALILDWHQQGFARSIDEMSVLVMHLLNVPPIKNHNEDLWSRRK